MIVDFDFLGLGGGMHSLDKKSSAEKMLDVVFCRPAGSNVYTNVRVAVRDLADKLHPVEKAQMPDAAYELYAAEGLAKDARLYLRGMDVPDLDCVEEVDLALVAGGLELRLGPHLVIFLDSKEARMFVSSIFNAVVSLLNIHHQLDSSRADLLDWARQELRGELGQPPADDEEGESDEEEGGGGEEDQSPPLPF